MVATIGVSNKQITDVPVRTFAARSILNGQTGELYKIQAGFVRTLTWSDDGTILVLGIWGTGDVVGSSLSSMNPYQIECLTRVEASIIPQQNTDLEHLLLSYLHHAERLMFIRSSRRVDIMLMKLLTWLADRFGQTTATGRLIDLRLTHQDLADLLGATRVTITRSLNQLEQMGYIEKRPLQRIVLQSEGVWHYEI